MDKRSGRESDSMRSELITNMTKDHLVQIISQILDAKLKCVAKTADIKEIYNKY